MTFVLLMLQTIVALFGVIAWIVLDTNTSAGVMVGIAISMFFGRALTELLIWIYNSSR